MKKYLLGIIAIFMAIAFSAFTIEKHEASGRAMQNYSYNDYPDDTNKNDPTHYTQVATLSCIGTAHRCGVIANDDGTGHPVLTGATILNKN
jgi:uncharacterized protein YxeA